MTLVLRQTSEIVRLPLKYEAWARGLLAQHKYWRQVETANVALSKAEKKNPPVIASKAISQNKNTAQHIKDTDKGERRLYRRQLVEAGKEFIECHDQLLCCALRGQAGKTFDVCKENTVEEFKRWREDRMRQRETQKKEKKN